MGASEYLLVIPALLVVAGTIAAVFAVRLRKSRADSARRSWADRMRRIEDELIRIQNLMNRLEQKLDVQGLQQQELVDQLYGQMSRMAESVATTRLSADDAAVSGRVPAPVHLKEPPADLIFPLAADIVCTDPLFDWFLPEADRRQVPWGELEANAAAHGTRVSLISGTQQDPKVVAFLGAEAAWSAVPMLRVPVSTADLSFFELRSYSGIDPIRARQVIRPARLTRQNDQWVALEKGLIDGAK